MGIKYTNEQYLEKMNKEDWFKEWEVLEEYKGYDQYISYSHKSCGTITKATPHDFQAKKGPCSNNECKLKKTRQTCFKNLGYENPAQSPEVKEKMKQTYSKRTGYENPSQNPVIKEKKKQTYSERTGYEHALQNPEVKEKYKQTCLKNFKVENYMQKNKTKDQIYWTENTLTLILQPENQGKTLQWWADKRGDKNPSYISKIFCYEENQHLRQYISYNKYKGPEKIKEILNSFGIEYEVEKKFENCKDIRFLPFDFYLPNFNLLIEFDGNQHFKSNEYFGGEEKFEETQKHDEIKDEYAKTYNINLLRIPYWNYENIEEIILNKLDEISGILEDVKSA